MYVLDHDRQISLIREMTQLRKDSDSWEVYYHQPTTNAMWKSYFPQANGENRGPKILRTEPLPESIDDRLATYLVEPVRENAIGLGIELSTRPGTWKEIIEIIEQNYRRYHRKQLPLFLSYLGVEEYGSLFNELNYNVDNLEVSESDLNALSRRSKIIRFKRFWSF